MAINSPLRRIVITAVFLLWLSPVLSAQDSRYFVIMDNDEPRFFQRLSWSASSNAKRYEVVLERETDYGYEPHERRFTTELSQYFTLSPGRYRFRVIPYDVLDRAGIGSMWSEIVVFPAQKPEIDNAAFEFILADDTPVYSLNVYGKNLTPTAKVFIRNSKGEDIRPIEIAEFSDGCILEIYFDDEKLLPGVYDLFIENPGGLKTGREGIVYDPNNSLGTTFSPSSFDLFFNAAWMPSIPVYGKNYGEQVSLFGLSARLGLCFTFLDILKIGPELTTSWSALDFDSFSEESSITIGAGILAQKWMFNQRVSFNFRIGAGYNKPSNDAGCFQLYVGPSFMWRFIEHFYFETGMEFTHFFNDLSPEYFRSWIGIGFMFFRAK